ncbi:MAG: hypothetical protein EBS55_07480 [Flavobacteriaceae bacterium]|nr:hypothetical protein [Flavobacteriaceae bacterium]
MLLNRGVFYYNVKLASCGGEKLFGIFDTYSERNLRIYNPFWLDLRKFISGIYKLAGIPE